MIKGDSSNMFKTRDQMNSTFAGTKSWKSPTVEGVERSFNEGARYFTTCKE
jgi:hypothetical protein